MVALGTALKPIEIASEEIMRVLFVEHDDIYRKQISKDLEQMGCRVDGVHDPHEAIEKLSKHKYELIIVDIGFPAPAISGDQFVVDHYPLMKGAQIVALTGQAHNIRFTEEFQRLGVEIIKKAEEEEPLKEVSQRVYQKAKDEVLKKVAEVSSGPVVAGNYPFAESFLSDLEQELLKNLNAIPEKEKKSINYKGQMYSIAELIEQVKARSTVGGDMIRMMLTLVKWRQDRASASTPHRLGDKTI